LRILFILFVVLLLVPFSVEAFDEKSSENYATEDPISGVTGGKPKWPPKEPESITQDYG
jgi:hypothetical protein